MHYIHDFWNEHLTTLQELFSLYNEAASCHSSLGRISFGVSTFGEDPCHIPSDKLVPYLMIHHTDDHCTVLIPQPNETWWCFRSTYAKMLSDDPIDGKYIESTDLLAIFEKAMQKANNDDTLTITALQNMVQSTALAPA